MSLPAANTVVVPVYRDSAQVYYDNGVEIHLPLALKKFGHFMISIYTKKTEGDAQPNSVERAASYRDRLIEACSTVFKKKLEYTFEKDTTTQKDGSWVERFDVILKDITPDDCNSFYSSVRRPTDHLSFGNVETVVDGRISLDIDQHNAIREAVQRAYFAKYPMTAEQLTKSTRTVTQLS